MKLKKPIINPVDLLVLLAFLLVIAGVLWKTVGEPAMSAAERKVKVTYTVRTRNVHNRMKEEVIYQMGRDPQLFTDNGFVDDAYLIDIQTEPSTQQLATDKGNIVTATDPTRIDLIFTLEAMVTMDGDLIRVGPQTIKNGLSHVVKTRRLEYLGSIESVILDE